MTDPHADVARLRLAANRAIDAPFAALAEQVETIILERARTAQDGTKRIDAAGRASILAELLRRLLAMRDALTAAIVRQIAASEALAIAQFEATDPPELPGTARDEAISDTALGAGIALLVAGALRRALTQVDRVLTGAVVTGVDAAIPAERITLFFDSTYAPRRDVGGRLLRANKPGAVPSWPARSGMGSAGVRRIAEHEITSAHGNQAILLAQRTLGYGVRWTLSPYHKESDECDEKANTDNGFGPGIYRADAAPTFPSHVLCRCDLTAVSLDQFEVAA